MSLVKIEELWPLMLCFYPYYDNHGGNGTRVLLEDGQVLTDKRKTKTLLEAMGRIFAADLAALRHKYQGVLGHKGLVPLPLHCDLVLVPFRVRRVQYKDHGATGYVVLDRVEGLKTVDSGQAAAGRSPLPDAAVSTRVVFRGGMHLDCMEKMVTVKKRLAEAGEVKEEYSRFHRGTGILSVRELVREGLPGGGEKIVYHIHYHTGSLPGTPGSFRSPVLPGKG